MEWLVSFAQRQARCSVGRERIEQEQTVQKTSTIKRAVGLMVREEGSAGTSYRQQQPCPLCDSPHILMKCESFKKMNALQRRSITRQLGYCFGCLRGGHVITNCRNASRCNIDDCNDRHSRWLHVTAGPKGGARATSYPVHEVAYNPVHGATIYRHPVATHELSERQGPSTSGSKGASTNSRQWGKVNAIGARDRGEDWKDARGEDM